MDRVCLPVSVVVEVTLDRGEWTHRKEGSGVEVAEMGNRIEWRVIRIIAIECAGGRRGEITSASSIWIYSQNR